MNEKIFRYIRSALLIASLVLPFCFLPFSPLPLGADIYGKTFLLGFFVSIALPLYLFTKLRAGSLTWQVETWHKPVLLLMASFLISTLLAFMPGQAWWGNLSNTGISFYLLVSLLLFFALLSDVFREYEQRERFFQHWLWIFPLLSTLSFLVVFFYAAHGLSALLRLGVGTPEDLAMFLSLLLVASLAYYPEKARGARQWQRILFIVARFFAVLVLIKIDFVPAWFVLLLGSVLSVLVLRMNGEQPGLSLLAKRGWLMILLALVSLNFLLNFWVLGQGQLLRDRFVKNLMLPWRESISFGVAVLKHDPLFGVGLENFGQAYSLYRPLALNQGSYWDIRFANSSSGLLWLIVSGGLVALLAFGFAVFALSGQALSLLRLPVADLKRQKVLMLVPLMLAVLLAFIIGPASLLLLILGMFVVWLLSSLVEQRDYDIPLPLERQRIIVIVLAISCFSVFAFSSKSLLADAGFGRSERSEQSLQAAAKLSDRFEHKLALARYYAAQTRQANKEGRRDEALAYQAKALESASQAEAAGAGSVVAQESTAAIYRDFADGGDGLNVMAMHAFERATALEPSNPVLWTELGQTQVKNSDHAAAEASFRKALGLKADYRQAELGLAKAIAGQGKKDEAIKMLEALSRDSGDANAYYELGLVYFNSMRDKDAIRAFSAAVTSSPLNSNALYGLGLAYERSGDKKQALFYYKKVQKLNPGNGEVNEKVKQLTIDN